jgi:hypothetical protein
MAKQELFVRKQSGGMFSVVNESLTTGNIFFVNSATGTDAAGYGQNPDAPCDTLDYAIGLCTANNGDRIYVMPAHAETVIAAGAIAADVAGVEIIGLGQGTDRPEFTFGTDNAASVAISAANVSIRNIVGIGNKDGLTNPINVTGANCSLDIEWQDTSSTVEAVRAVLATAAANFNCKIKYRGFTAGNGSVNVVKLDQVTRGRIDIDAYGRNSTGTVEFQDTACVDIEVVGYIYNADSSGGNKLVVDTATGSTWFADIRDGVAGAKFSGGSGATLAADDVSTVATLVGTADSATTDNLHGKIGTDTEMADRSLYDILNGGGPAAADAAAAPANDVSIYSVIRDIWDGLRNGTGGSEPGVNKSLADAIGFDGVAAIAASAGMLRVANGTSFIVSKTVVASAIVAAGADLTAVSTVGEVLIEDVIIQNGATQMDSGANGAVLELYTDNVAGNGSFITDAEAKLLANVVLSGATHTTNNKVVLETGKKVRVKATTEDFTSAGNVTFHLICRRLADNATLAAAA